MEEYETINNTHIPMNKRAGWVNIYKSEKVQSEIDKILASPNYLPGITEELHKMTFEDERMKALKFIMDEYEENVHGKSLSDIIDETP